MAMAKMMFYLRGLFWVIPCKVEILFIWVPFFDAFSEYNQY